MIPAVTHQSRRKSLVVVGGVSALFVAGVAFGYFVVLPVALHWLLSFGGDTFSVQLRAGEYYSFITTMLLASGILFEVPVAMLAFARMGLVTPRCTGASGGWPSWRSRSSRPSCPGATRSA